MPTRAMAVGAGIGCTLVGGGLMLPAIVGRAETGTHSRIGLAMIALGVVVIAGGLGAILLGSRQRLGEPIPGAVRAAIAAVAVFLAFFALELSDGLVRQGGRTMYWSSFLFLPAVALLYGLLAGRRWAWWACRIVFALAVVWFLAFVVIIPFAKLESNGSAVPWYGRAYMIAVSIVFAAILAFAFKSLGRLEARRYFQLPS